MTDVEEGRHTWSELADRLNEKLKGPDAEVTCEFENLELFVPSAAGENAEYAHWMLNGTVKIQAKEEGS